MQTRLKKRTAQISTEKKTKAAVDPLSKQRLIFDLDNSTSPQQVFLMSSDNVELTRPLAVIAKTESFTYEEFIKKHLNPDGEKCSICMFEFSKEDENKIAKLDKCEGHFFHIDCIEMCHTRAHLKCPICGVIYGVMTGDMPSGTMSVRKYPASVLELEGIPNTGVLEITYKMKSGNRGHINFPSTTRVAFLPCNDEGKEILRLLLIAFERKLTFTIGTSVTTGRPNQIVWNGIHHKTSVEGGPSFFGYPDPTYFLRIREELAAKGIY